jgi:CRISPR-associated protein Csm1
MLNLLEKSVRVALAGYLHDAGKLLLRASGAPKELGAGASEDHSGASVKVAQKVFATLSSRLDGDVNEFGRDALLTAIGDHHAPRNLLGSIVSTADRLSHGIGYKQWLAAESNFRDSGGEPECVMRLAPVFSSAGSNRPSMYMPLKPLSPNGIFPVASALPSVATARVEYQNLWNAFDSGISKKLPGLGGDLELWFEAFDSLWMSCTHGVPAAPAHGARGNVSLYEHSRVTAAFATALWRWHVDTGETCELALARLNSSNAVEDAKEKFLLVHGYPKVYFWWRGEFQ